MKISVLTPTYNRANILDKLYRSLIENSKEKIELEWLIMDDGSTDKTKEIIQKWQEENKIQIKYYFQENKGKMKALNNLVEKATGEIIIECDSDDYFMTNAFQIIKETFEKYKEEQDLYAFCFLKYNQDGNNMGRLMKTQKTTMFDLYFKDGEDGEKCLVFKSNIRKQYKHQLEKEETFVTEARMYHKMDLDYQILCVNEPIMICEYQKDGYSKNIKEEFKKNPYGYYEYFKEIFEHDMKDVKWKKRLYTIKHYILFTCLTKKKNAGKYVKGNFNKMLYNVLYIPGMLKTKKRFQ